MYSVISKNNNCKIPYVSRESPIKLIESPVPSGSDWGL